MRSLALFALFLLFVGCSSTRIPLPVGEIPTQSGVPLEDEKYGHEVFNQLVNRFPLDRDDARILRARSIVDKLTTVRGNNQNIWHVYVLKDDSFHNAGATRGNYIFIWSALLDTISDDGELSAILAHEIGHVLAGHTQPDPMEEVNEMLASIAGTTAKQAIIQTGSGSLIGLASIGGMLASELLKAFIVNPDKQVQELEADQLGLFLMAEAGYDPAKAISFWIRAKDDPNFQSSPVEFLSTHPSTETRLEELKAILPEAMARYEQFLRGEPIITAATESQAPSSTSSFVVTDSVAQPYTEERHWIAAEDGIPVYSSPSPLTSSIASISKGERVSVVHRTRRWLFIQTPYEGYVESPRFYPEK